MSSENDLLKAIHKHGGEVSLKKLAQEAGFGIDYTRYLLNQLVKSKFVSVSRRGREEFKVTERGKKQVVSHALREDAGAQKEKREFRESKVVLTHNLNEDAEKFQEVSIGKTIEKAAKALKGLSSCISSLKNKSNKD